MLLKRGRFGLILPTSQERDVGHPWYCGIGSGGLQEGYGLYACYLEAFAAADVFAGDHVVCADHVGLGFGEAGTVALVGVAGDPGFFAANEPA